MKKICKFCGSVHTIKQGIHITTKGRFQRYKCNRCGRVFIGEKRL